MWGCPSRRPPNPRETRPAPAPRRPAPLGAAENTGRRWPNDSCRPAAFLRRSCQRQPRRYPSAISFGCFLAMDCDRDSPADGPHAARRPRRSRGILRPSPRARSLLGDCAAAPVPPARPIPRACYPARGPACALFSRQGSQKSYDFKISQKRTASFVERQGQQHICPHSTGEHSDMSFFTATAARWLALLLLFIQLSYLFFHLLEAGLFLQFPTSVITFPVNVTVAVTILLFTSLTSFADGFNSTTIAITISSHFQLQINSGITN